MLGKQMSVAVGCFDDMIFSRVSWLAVFVLVLMTCGDAKVYHGEFAITTVLVCRERMREKV